MSEKEYFHLLERLRKGAGMISNPFLPEKKRKEYLKLYNAIEHKILAYKGFF
jgi:hypothetical protein